MPYRDLREYLTRLEETGNLWKIKAEVDKDWEIAAVARRVFQKIPEERRKGLLFENVKGFKTPVCGGILGASREIYALSLETTVDKIQDRWEEARKNPLPPIPVREAACKENILTGDQIDLLQFPVPIWTVGEDPGPFLTSAQICSHDPDSKVRNIGTYRVQMKSSRRVGLFVNEYQDLRRTVTKNERNGVPTPVGIVVGTEPTTALVSVTKLPYEVDEFAQAGGLRGAPIEIVRCETNDVDVPATSEIVIEGKIVPGEREHEGPFGEYTGYMGP
ncbi:MAG TPA: UbiD family decarboxylase, partial [bacterium]|nr:UbiD family decarboxylase [bacterium]